MYRCHPRHICGTFFNYIPHTPEFLWADLTLKIGSLAAPKDIPFGSHFIIKNLPGDVQTDNFIVDDRGSAITWMNNHTMKVDVYVKRKPGESDATYFRRTNDLGIIYTTALYKSPK